MYRLLLVIVLCMKTASSAPQTKDSDVTYVKIQPVIEDTPVEASSNIRESRIEKLPLTIPSKFSSTDSKEPDKILKGNSQNKSELTENVSNISEITSDLTESKSDLEENLDLLESKQSDTLADASEKEEVGINTTDDLSDISSTDDLSESNTDNLSDTVPSETNQTGRQARNFDSVETTETTDDVTERYEDELIEHTTLEAPRAKALPKFVPKGPKLSYFQKPRVFQSYSSPNQVENASKRRFRSRCSCQKIWNCPKLQITVPRCPDEYFLCCF